MDKKKITILVSISCVLLIIGCAGKSKNEIKIKLSEMSDKELINHYEMIEMRMIDIDRERERSLEKRQEIDKIHYPGNYQNHFGHLHIGDNWNALKREKELTEIEMRRRNILLP